MIKLILIGIIFYIIYTSLTNKQGRIVKKDSKPCHLNPYEVLKISPNASKEEIRSAYVELSKKNHPDLVSHMAKDFQSLAEKNLKQINWAYQELKKKNGF